MKQQFIAGIYNYCDRWCERCTFTTRCRNFESTGKVSSEQLDINNEAFWKTISDNFARTFELLHQAAKEHGIDLDNLMTKEEEEAYEKKQSFIKIESKNHHLSKLCKQYQEIVLPFAKNSEGMVDKTRELTSELHIGIKTEEDVVYTMADIGDCFEIIQWYVFLIDAKLQRALHGKLEDDEDEEVQTDSNGSAKIALISIERSMNAWIKLYELMPASEDTALKALSLLSRLKQTALTEFSNAILFKRPGFDD